MHEHEELQADHRQTFQGDAEEGRFREVREYDEIDGEGLEERDELGSDAFKLINQTGRKTGVIKR